MNGSYSFRLLKIFLDFNNIYGCMYYVQYESKNISAVKKCIF